MVPTATEASSIPPKATFRPGRPGSISSEPTREEEQLVERMLGLDVPTREEMKEIEPSSRLFERGDAIYMTLSTLYGIEEGQPAAEPIAFVLAGNRLVTVRYTSPKPFRMFAEHVQPRARAGARRADGAGPPARHDHRPAGRRAGRMPATKSSGFPRQIFHRERGQEPPHPGDQARSAADAHRTGAIPARADSRNRGQLKPGGRLPCRLGAAARRRRTSASMC